MNEDRISKALRSVGDRYVRENPADYEAFRERVEGKHRRRWVVVGIGATTVATTAVAALLYFGGDARTTDTVPPPAGEVGLTKTTEVALDGFGKEIASSEDVAWVTVPETSSIWEVPIGAAEARQTFTLTGAPLDILQGQTGLWASIPERDEVVRIDPDSGAIVEISLAPYSDPTRVHVGELATRVVVNEGVVKIDAATLEQELIFDEPVTDFAMGTRGLWILTPGGTLRVIDPDNGNEVDVTAARGLSGIDAEITYLRGALWHGDSKQTRLTRIDESTGQITDRIALPGSYVDIDAGEEGLWVLVRREVGGSVHQLDESDGSLTGGEYTFKDAPTDMSVNDRGIWTVLARSILHLDS